MRSAGQLKGEILIANYSVGDDITRIKLSADGLSVVEAKQLVGGFNDPLPLAQGPDGTIYVGELGAQRVTALIPAGVAQATPTVTPTPSPTSSAPGVWTTKQKMPVADARCGRRRAGRTSCTRLPARSRATFTSARCTSTIRQRTPGARARACRRPTRRSRTPALPPTTASCTSSAGRPRPSRARSTNAAVYRSGDEPVDNAGVDGDRARRPDGPGAQRKDLRGRRHG